MIRKMSESGDIVDDSVARGWVPKNPPPFDRYLSVVSVE